MNLSSALFLRLFSTYEVIPISYHFFSPAVERLGTERNNTVWCLSPVSVLALRMMQTTVTLLYLFMFHLFLSGNYSLQTQEL